MIHIFVNQYLNELMQNMHQFPACRWCLYIEIKANSQEAQPHYSTPGLMCFLFSTLTLKYMNYEENISKWCLWMADRKASQNLGNVAPSAMLPSAMPDRHKFQRSTPRMGYCWQWTAGCIDGGGDKLESRGVQSTTNLRRPRSQMMVRSTWRNQVYKRRLARE